MKRMIDNKDYEALKNDVKDVEGHTSAYIITNVVVEDDKILGTQVKDVENDVTYNLPLGSEVEANPTLEGTESDLEGIKIDGTKYKVGGGKQLYQHVISVNNWNILITSEISTKLTFTQLREILYNKGCTGYSTTYPASGVTWASDKLCTIFGCFASSLEGNISMVYRSSQSSYGAEEITSVIYSSNWDKVSPL